ncbi:MAG: tRNA dihydrouridine synthase DusB [Firmicutes bacterium]|nr:tRNA dihydrouridine synthase DusB [Bacillota bacterium]
MTAEEKRNTALKIGSVELESPFLLAPLAGITDAPMRRIARQMGAALTYSEMVSGKGLMYGDKNTERLLAIYDDEKPVAYQIFGCEPKVMEYTARTLAARENALLDINMGCPVPKIVKNGEGSALMKNPDLVYDVVCAAVRGAERGAREIGAAPKPVTIKTRIGFTADTLNAVEIAKAAEAAGAAAVAVHGRTREQYYSGKADWQEIAKVKSALRVPVIGNGDVFTGEDAMAIINETGCDFVMIARGALGNPWIFRDALALYRGEEKPSAPSANERIKMLMHHFDDLQAFKGEYAAVREMRKQVGWYLKGIRGSADVRRRVNSITDASAMQIAFAELLGRV